MCRYFCIEFIELMLKGKNLLEYTNLFSPTEYKKWQNNVKIFSVCNKYRKFKKLKYHIFLK